MNEEQLKDIRADIDALPIMQSLKRVVEAQTQATDMFEAWAWEHFPEAAAKVFESRLSSKGE